MNTGLFVLSRDVRIFRRMPGNRNQLVHTEHMLQKGQRVPLGGVMRLNYDHRLQEVRDVRENNCDDEYFVLVEELGVIEEWSPKSPKK